MTEPNVLESRPKFTKGEKCILAHLILTVAVTIVLLIIYLIHIFVVPHGDSIEEYDTRRSFLKKDFSSLQEIPIGLLFVNITPIRNICNTVLLTQAWSISTGHCVAMRSDPDLSYLLYDWRIKYPYDNAGFIIIRSIVHPHFCRDTFANNVGLLEHNPVRGFQKYKVPKINEYDDIESKNLAIISWDHGSFESKGGLNKIVVGNVQLMTMENCTSYIAPIIELRPYEFCVILRRKTDTLIGHGAAIIDSKDFNIYGTFTWGEREQTYLPLIVINLSHFKDWVESVTLFVPLR